MSPLKPKHTAGHVHFKYLAASIPICPMSLSFENGPVPSLFLALAEHHYVRHRQSHVAVEPPCLAGETIEQVSDFRIHIS